MSQRQNIRMFTLPNMLTLANLACGCMATVLALSTGGRLTPAFWFVVAAAVFDFADGFAARLTGQYSDLGKQLDSLADMVSFGVAPSAVLWVMYRDSLALWSPGPFTVDYIGLAVFTVALFSALRLAKFNIDESQTREFVGLPTPANALMIAALGWQFYHGRMETVREIILAFAFVMSWLLISPVRMFSLKFKDFHWHGNELRYLFLGTSAALVAWLGIGGIPAATGLYIVVSVIRHFNLRPEKQPEKQPEEQPEKQPEIQPEKEPEKQPEIQPEEQPEKQPEEQPKKQPAKRPRKQPEKKPEKAPGKQPEKPPRKRPVKAKEGAAVIAALILASSLALLSPGPASAQFPAVNPVQPQQPGMPGQATRPVLPNTQDNRQSGVPGQRRNTTRDEEPATPFFGEGSEVEPESDTAKKKRPKQPLESYFFPDSVRGRQIIEWTVDRFANHIDISHTDTLQQEFQTDFPFMKKGVGSAYLGNLGAPSQYLSYFDRQESRDHSFANPWNVYLRTVESTPFYNTKDAFTQFNYAWAGQKAQQEENLGIFHAQNYSPQTGFNLNYKSLGTKGIYTWQATRDKTLSLAFSHTGKRYTVQAGYIYNSVYNRENGGLVDDDDVIIDINDHELPQSLPMRMSDPRNWIKNNTYFITQSYGVPLRRVRDEDFTIADRPAIFVGHTLEYNRWVRRYEDTYPGTIYEYTDNSEPAIPYYDHWYIDPARSRDSLFEGQLSNRVFVQIQPWNRDGVIGVIDGGIGVDTWRFYQFSRQNYLTGKSTTVKESSYYVYAGVDGHIKKYFDWAGKFTLHPFGYRSGDVEFDASAAARIFIKDRPVSVSGTFRFSSLEPSYWEQNLSTNHFRWSNSFQKENETRFDVTLRVPHLGFEATGSQSVLGRKVYYGADFLPRQSEGVVSVTGLYLREDLRIGIRTSSINLNHRVMLQWSTNQKVVPVPLASLFLSYFYEFNVVRDVLRLQIGVDGRYNTRYYAPGYNPGLAQFYNQRDKMLGDYVWMDVFVNAKWKRMRILVKMQHLNDDLFGVRNYFSVPHYPMNRRVLKIGFSWNFYD